MVYHHLEDRCDGQLFITVLAYQAVRVVRRKLKEHWIKESRASLRETLGPQYWITATFKQRGGKALHIRQATRPEEELGHLYAKQGISPAPGGLQKITIQQDIRNVVPEPLFKIYNPLRMGELDFTVLNMG